MWNGYAVIVFQSMSPSHSLAHMIWNLYFDFFLFHFLLHAEKVRDWNFRLWKSSFEMLLNMFIYHLQLMLQLHVISITKRIYNIKLYDNYTSLTSKESNCNINNILATAVSSIYDLWILSFHLVLPLKTSVIFLQAIHVAFTPYSLRAHTFMDDGAFFYSTRVHALYIVRRWWLQFETKKRNYILFSDRFIVAMSNNSGKCCTVCTLCVLENTSSIQQWKKNTSFFCEVTTVSSHKKKNRLPRMMFYCSAFGEK
jgi:hypothetical protein